MTKRRSSHSRKLFFPFLIAAALSPIRIHAQESNRVINTGFTIKGNTGVPEGWQWNPGPDGSTTKLSVEEVDGLRALRIVDQNPKVGVGLLQTIAVEGGKSYRAAMRLKGGRLALYLNWLDEAKKIIPPEHNKSFEGRPGSFESFGLTENAPANARFAQLWIYSSSSAQTEAWAAEPSLTETLPVKESLKIPVPERALIEKLLRREHPRLLLTASDLERVKGLVAGSALMKKSFEIMRAKADGMLTQEPCRYEIPDGLRLLATSRLVLDRTYVLGLSFLLTGEKKYRDRLWVELESAGKFQDWNPRHTLDTAEMLHAFGIGYDWLYKDWTEEQRKFLVEAIAVKGLTPMVDAYRGKGPTVWWVGGDNNWNFVCNGGGSIAALSIYEDRPELASDVLTNAFRSFQHVMAEFEPDGAWYEGPGYWHFSIKYLVPWFRSFETALGTNFGVLKAFPAFSKTSDFPVHLTGPSGYSFNFADAGSGKTGSMPKIFWFASRMQNPLWQAFEKERLSGAPEELLYFDPDLERHEKIEAPKDLYFRKTEVATLRSDWSSNALWLGLKAGANGVNHSHDDLGSFVLDANGARFFEDLGMEQKTYVSYQHHIPHDDFYRIRPEGHNTLVINPGRESGQYGKANVAITPFVSETGSASASVDLKPAYEDVKRLRRKIELKENRKTAQVTDEIETTKPSVVWWFAHTKAEIALAADGRSALLTRPEGDLRAELLSPSEARFLIMPAAPLPESPNPDIQNKNIGFRKLAVVLSNVAKAELTVRFIPGAVRTRKSTTLSLGDNFKPLTEKARLVEAEDFYAQTGGKVDVTVKISNSGKSFKGWDASGHAISWKINVAESGTYGLLVRYCTQEDFALRTLRVDEQNPAGDEVFSFPSTGGYSSSADNWREAWFIGKNGGLRLKLAAGAHTLTLVNAGAPLNLDWLKIVPLRD